MESEIIEKTNYEKFLDFVNQPFMIAIIVAVIVGVFALLIVRELYLGKKSVKEQNKRIDKQEKSYKDYATELNEKKNELIIEKNTFIKESKEEFNKFYSNNEDFRKAVFSALESINNIGVKKALEEYKNGKAEETKDN